MNLDAKKALGKRVRLLQGYFIYHPRLPLDWTGTIVAVKQSLAGNPTEYLLRGDKRYGAIGKLFYVRGDELEPL